MKDIMTKYQRFVVEHYLQAYPTDMGFSEVILDLLRSNPNCNMSAQDDYKTHSFQELAIKIVEMDVRLIELNNEE